MGNALVLWRSNAQKDVATSPGEAEYVGMAEEAKDAVLVRNIMEEYGYKQDGPTDMEADCEPAMNIIKNVAPSHALRHVDVAFKHVNEKYRRKIIGLTKVTSDDQTADIFTKASLSRQKHWKFTGRLLSGYDDT